MLKRFASNWLPVILWCSLIFYLSSIPNLKTDLEDWDTFLRKIAHMTEYTILFLLSRRALVNSAARMPRGRAAVLALAFTVLYAASDEYHQSFVSTRDPSVIDVGIDTTGALLAFAVFSVWQRSGKKI